MKVFKVLAHIGIARFRVRVQINYNYTVFYQHTVTYGHHAWSYLS